MLFLIAFLVALLAGAEQAHASFLIAPILTAVGFSAVAAEVIGVVIVAAVSIGVELLLAPKQQNAAEDGGVQLEMQLAPDVPESLLVGRCVVAGSRVYAETYGDNNTNCIESIAIADHPVEGLVAVYVETQLAVLTDTATTRGSTVDDYDGNVALKFYDGSQVAADPFAVEALSIAERPWTTDRLYWQRSYARVHYIYNRDKVTGPLAWKFVINGARLYNPAKDSTVGGDGTHRFDDLSTHEFTSNLAVIAYNILRGIRVKDGDGNPVHFYGLQDTPAENLPLDNWLARIAEADAPVETADGTEPQYHGGLEIPVDMEPVDAAREVLKATGGRLVEIGGIYKLYWDAPGLPVFTITDKSFPATKGSTGNPILPLEQIVTYVSGSYMSPDDGWVQKQATPRIDAAREAAIGQRVESDLQAMMIQSDSHMQRVMQQIINRAQRTRRHTEVLPPALFGVEPGDVGEFTSVKFGYADKLFEVQTAEIDVGLFTTVELLEVDHADYDWSRDDLLPTHGGSTVVTRPGAKVVDEWGVQAFVHEGDNGVRKPAIEVSWNPPLDDDLIGITIRIRRPADPTNIVSIAITDPAAIAAGQAIILSNLAPLTAYEVQAEFQSFNGFSTAPTLWVPVTTPDTRISEAELDSATVALFDQLKVASQAALAPAQAALNARLDQLAQTTAGLVALLQERIEGSIVNYIGQRFGDSLSEIEDVRTVAQGLADLFLQVFVGDGDSSTAGLFRITAVDAPAGVASRIQIETRASTADDFAAAGIMIDAGVTALGGKPQLTFYAQIESGDPVPVMKITGGEVQIVGARLRVTDDDGTSAAAFDGSFIEDLTVGTLKFVQGSILNPQVGGGAGVSLQSEVTSSGAYQSSWHSLCSFDVDVDDLTENIIVCLSLVQVVLLGVPSGGTAGVEVHMKRGSTEVSGPYTMHPGGSQVILPWMGLLLDVPAVSPGTVTYTLEARLNKVSGGAGTIQWAASTARAFLFQPKTGI